MNEVSSLLRLKHKLIEIVFTSKFSSYLSPLIEYLVLSGALNVWDGIYDSWEEAPQDNDVLEGKIWINKVARQAQSALAAYHSGKVVSLASSTQDYVLSLVGGILLPTTKGDLRILDFGGGMAASYFPLVSALEEPERVEFHIVEVKAICDLSKEILEDFPKLFFYEELPELSRPVHIVHAGSSLQYIPDWKGLLSKFAGYQPELLILEDVPTGNIPTFITTQNFYGKKVRSRFLNIDDLIGALRELEYDLIYKSRCTQNFLGKTGGPLPMKNFPPKYRLKYGSHLIFRRMKP
ncbi:MAG: methyltransferase, TIGR04325 family [Nitrospinota bacterium]